MQIACGAHINLEDRKSRYRHIAICYEMNGFRMSWEEEGMNHLLSVKEVAALLQTSRVQVRRMIQSGDLAALKVGREYRIPLAALEAFVQAALE